MTIALGTRTSCFIIMQTSERCCCRPAWTHQASAPIFSTPVVDTTTSTVFVAAVDGAVTALSHLGQPQWHCNLGTQIFAPLCLLGAGQEVVTQEAAVAVRGTQLSGTSPQQMLLPGNVASTAAAGIKPYDVRKDHVTHQEAAAAGGAEAAVVVGSAEGELHCISCLHGQQLWKTSMGSGISTAATVCDVLSSCSHTSRGALAQTHSQLARTGQTQAEPQAGSMSRGQTPPDAQMPQTCAHRQRRAQKQAQLSSDLQLHSHTDARAGSPTHSQTVSGPHAQLHSPAQSKASQLLVTCTNAGAVRVVRLPTASSATPSANPSATPSAGSDRSVLKPAIRQTAGSHTSAGTTGKADNDISLESLQEVAAVQMPGMCQAVVVWLVHVSACIAFAVALLHLGPSSMGCCQLNQIEAQARTWTCMTVAGAPCIRSSTQVGFC